jgi:hypothetical protein
MDAQPSQHRDHLPGPGILGRCPLSTPVAWVKIFSIGWPSQDIRNQPNANRTGHDGSCDTQIYETQFTSRTIGSEICDSSTEGVMFLDNNQGSISAAMVRWK